MFHTKFLSVLEKKKNRYNDFTKHVNANKIYSIFPQTGNVGTWIFLSSNIYYSFNNYSPTSL